MNVEDLGVDGKIILKRVLRNWDMGAWTGSIGLSIRTDYRHL